MVACGLVTLMGAVMDPAPTLQATMTFTPNPSATPAAVHTPTFTAAPSNTPPPPVTPLPTVSPTPTVIPDTGWKILQPGLERRVINLFDDQGTVVEQFYLLRIDPAAYRFDVQYDEGARSLAQWQAETGALIVLNGGYFRMEKEKYLPNGLAVVDGQRIGSSFGSFAGMLAVTATGPELRWLAQQPYDPAEPLSAALQSFPILVKPGGDLGFPAENEDNKRARRTVIGRDRNGKILLLVTAKNHFTLHQLSSYLTTSDLDVDIAINLDGGKSSGMLLARPAEGIPSFGPLPVVITVHQR